MDTVCADVVVVGSGAAGLMAAIAARRHGAEVAVLGKSAPGKGTSTTLAVGAFAGAWDGLSADDYKARTLAAGRGLNDVALVDILADEAPARFRDLLDWGLRAKSAPGAFMALPAEDGDEREPVWGREIVRCLVAKAEALGVAFVSGAVVRAIEAGESGVRVEAYSARRRSWLELTGGAAVLAAGGAGGLYLHHDNPQRMTGDAGALAFEAGAVLQDLEFVQFYPIAIAERGQPFLIEPEGADLGRIVNANGEDILDKYAITVRPAATHARDSLSQALFHETEIEGREVFLDLTAVSKDEWCAHPISATKWAFLSRRYDAWNRPLRIAPVAHFAVGGASIDGDGATSVAGLYAAGEAAAGVHGANRMGGNALSETVVFGHRAGAAAARWAEGRDRGKAMARARVVHPVDGTARADAGELMRALRRVMWSCGGIRRDRTGLEKGLGEIDAIAAEAARLRGINEPRRLEKALELQLAARAAGLILAAALRREESRGVHFRADFPAPDDAWLGHWKVARAGEGARWWFEPLPEAGR